MNAQFEKNFSSRNVNPSDSQLHIMTIEKVKIAFDGHHSDNPKQCVNETRSHVCYCRPSGVFSLP